MDIRFGTSGWRAIIADEFTFANVRLVIQAICRYLTTSEHGSGTRLIIRLDVIAAASSRDVYDAIWGESPYRDIDRLSGRE
jgi:phosphomannomutase